MESTVSSTDATPSVSEQTYGSTHITDVREVQRQKDAMQQDSLTTAKLQPEHKPENQQKFSQPHQIKLTDQQQQQKLQLRRNQALQLIQEQTQKNQQQENRTLNDSKKLRSNKKLSNLSLKSQKSST